MILLCGDGYCKDLWCVDCHFYLFLKRLIFIPDNEYLLKFLSKHGSMCVYVFGLLSGEI